MTKAIILAAGRGSRLHPYTEKIPKCLTELAGRPLIEWQVDAFQQASVEDIYIVAGYQEKKLNIPGTKKILNPEWASTNMVESLFCAAPIFGDDLVVCYSDIIFEQTILNQLIASKHDVSVVIDKKWRQLWEFRFDNPLDDAESLRTDQDGLITEIGNPVDDINSIMAQYIGLMRFCKSGVGQLIEAKKNLSLNERGWKKTRPVQQAYMTDLLMEMILMEIPVHGVPINGGWLEVDTVEDFHKYQNLIEQGDLGRFLVAPNF